jgi:hypothetical protein
MGRVSGTGGLGQISLGIRPLIIMGWDPMKGSVRRVVGTLFGVIEEDRSRVVRGRGASSALDQLRGRVPRVVRRGGRVIIRRWERSLHSVELSSEMVDGQVIKIKRCGSEVRYELGQVPRGLTAGEAAWF